MQIAAYCHFVLEIFVNEVYFWRCGIKHDDHEGGDRDEDLDEMEKLQEERKHNLTSTLPNWNIPSIIWHSSKNRKRMQTQNILYSPSAHRHMPALHIYYDITASGKHFLHWNALSQTDNCR